MKKYTYIVLACVLFLPFFTKVNALTNDEKQAIYETAHAYLRQGTQLQYDGLRKQLTASPEDATSKNTLYTVCSGFVYQVYWQTFGIKLPDETKELIEYAELAENKDKVVVYYGTKNEIYSEGVLGSYGDQKSYQKLVTYWNENNILQTGDIIVVQSINGGGHTGMIIEQEINGKKELTVIEASEGGTYNYTSYKDNYEGTKVPNKELLEFNGGTLTSRKLAEKLYIYKWYDNECNKNGERCDNRIQKLIVIRPVGNGNNAQITESAKTRIAYPKIDIEKIIKNVGDQSFAYLEDELTYKITISNGSSKDYNNLKIVEEVDSNLNITDKGNGNLINLSNGNYQLEWITNIPAGGSKTIEYTVKVPSNKDLIGKIFVSKGKVGEISNSKIETLIRYKLNSTETAKLQKKFNELKNDKNVGASFINNIYKQALNLDLGISDLDKQENMLKSIMKNNSKIAYGTEDKLSVYMTELLDSKVLKHILHNFYGLRLGKEYSSTNNTVRATSNWNIYSTSDINDRVRTITKEKLLDGDIILGYMKTSETDSKLINKSYIYFNNTLYRKSESNVFEEISGNDLDVFLRNLVGQNYTVLRPIVKKVVHVDLESEKVQVFQNAKNLDLSNSKMTVYYTDQTTETVNLSNENVQISGFDSSKVGKNTVMVKYNGYETTFDIEIVEKPVSSINFGTYKAINNKILIWSSVPYIPYNIFTNNIKVTGASYKIFKSDTEVKNVNITNGMIIRVYDVNNDIIETYEICFEYILFNLPIREESNLIVGLKVGDNRKYLTNNNMISTGLTKVFNLNDEELESESKLGTGYKLIVDLISGKKEYLLSVKGDVTGDGKATISDVMKIANQVLEPSTIKDDCYLKAGDITGDGVIKLNDVMKLANHILIGGEI